jgi:hypothetical protein
MTREEYKELAKDLDKSEFLYGLSGDNYEVIRTHMQCVDWDKPKTNNTLQCILPVIRRTLSLILPGEQQLRVFKTNPEVLIKALKRLSVDEIIIKMDIVNIALLPVVNRYLPMIDSQAEVLGLLATDYVYSLVKEIDSTVTEKELERLYLVFEIQKIKTEIGI